MKTDWWNDTFLSLSFVHDGTTQRQSCFPILTTVYFTLDSSALQISLTLLWLTFLKNTLFALVPPAGWILKCSENTTG